VLLQPSGDAGSVAATLCRLQVEGEGISPLDLRSTPAWNECSARIARARRNTCDDRHRTHFTSVATMPYVQPGVQHRAEGSPPGLLGRSRVQLDRYARQLGPGLITGAADDDPSGICTYTQMGAAFGYQLAWTMLFSLPFMIAIQEICARISCTSGRGIADNLRRHYPKSIGVATTALLASANTLNLGADLGAIGASVHLLVGGRHAALYTIAAGVFCACAEVYFPYKPYAASLKWLTLSLFAYVAVAAVVRVPWHEALLCTFVPRVPGRAAITTLLAGLGTTISPYLFFWQASQEREERLQSHGQPALMHPATAVSQFGRIRIDTQTGMAFSNLIALFIIYAAAATLHPAGVTTVAIAADAAEALRPIAGAYASAVFAAGVIGTGLLAVPVLAGGVAYAASETFRWTEGLNLRLSQARAFYGTIALSTAVGIALNFTGITPMRSLFWCAVLNGIIAAPLMALIMLLAANGRVMGRLTLSRTMRLTGWVATLLMALASLLLVL
jgi:Mn2+/Fe2+ NRAMP family transporter